MLHRRVLLVCCMVGLAIGLARAAEGPIDIGSRRELFVDDYLIAKMTSLTLKLQEPTPREVAVVHDKPWEGNTSAYHTVFRDGDLFRMYFRGCHFDNKTRKSPHGQLVAYAESKDAIHWTKPDLGLFEFQGSKKNAIVWMGVGSHNFAPFKDTNPACPPDARYKALGSGKGGLVAFKSPDAIHWTLIRPEPVITKGAFDSQNLAFWDSVRGRYVDFHRGFRDGRRDIMTCTSTDFVNWTEPVWLEYPGAAKRHLYTNQITAYYRAPHIFMGFPKRFVPSRKAVKAACPGGISDGGFMTSRDGLKFHLWDEALIRPGLQRERWVTRNNLTAWGILETKAATPGLPNELSLYSTEGYYLGDSCQVRRFTVRLDGFVSLNALYKGGEMTTKPLVFRPAADKPAPKPQPLADGPVVVETAKPIFGKASLRFKAPTILKLPGTKQLGAKVTFAVHVRGVPSGHRRLFSAYNGGSSKPNELWLDIDSDTDMGSGSAIRLAYDGQIVAVPAAKLANWSKAKDPNTVHHIAATYDDGVVAIYFDGKLVGAGGKAGLGPIALKLGDLRFAEDYPPTSRTNEPFLGTADDILVLRRVLSPAEVAALAAKGAAATLKLDADDGVLYTFDTVAKGVVPDLLPHDGAQNTRVPVPQAPGEVELVLNFSTSAAGSIRVEIQDADGKPIPGYTLAECDEVFGDQIERAVTWHRSSEVKPLVGKPIRLRFVMKDADLFSLRFR